MSRYIDADALTEKVIEFIEHIGKDKEGTPKLQGFVATCLLGLINVVPTADVRPIVRGKWGNFWKCSVCGTQFDIGTEHHINFCPNCGADMRGRSE